jgi:hypothetical protein
MSQERGGNFANALRRCDAALLPSPWFPDLSAGLALYTAPTSHTCRTEPARAACRSSSPCGPPFCLPSGRSEDRPGRRRPCRACGRLGSSPGTGARDRGLRRFAGASRSTNWNVSPSRSTVPPSLAFASVPAPMRDRRFRRRRLNTCRSGAAVVHVRAAERTYSGSNPLGAS